MEEHTDARSGAAGGVGGGDWCSSLPLFAEPFDPDPLPTFPPGGAMTVSSKVCSEINHIEPSTGELLLMVRVVE